VAFHFFCKEFPLEVSEPNSDQFNISDTRNRITEPPSDTLLTHLF
jgi:hypothetical protein